MISRVTEPVTKVITLGPSGVGKTALIRRIETGKFNVYLEATVGCVYIEKEIDGHRFEFWDTAGQERYRAVVPQYYKNARIIILMFDVSNLSTLQDLAYYVELLAREKTYHPDIKFIIVGNKTDLSHEDTNKITKKFRRHPVVKMYGFGLYEPIYISVKDDENINLIVEEFLKYARRVAEEPEFPMETIDLGQPEIAEAGCSC